jgi:5'-nucleotidase (lipoprotein e(P4) family)
MKKFIIIFLISIGLISLFQNCSNSSAFYSNPNPEPSAGASDYLTMAILYQQTAAEYRALCYQAFNFARYKLDQSSKIMGIMKKQAIVVDIDETVLDNSPYEANTIIKSWIYPEGWNEWIDAAKAKAIPGALEFLKYAESKGVETYYISNRTEEQRSQTLKNLSILGFPYAVDDHLLLKSNESSKKARRDKVVETRFIVMLLGDNLNDFSEVFEKKSIQERYEMTDSLKNEFGNRFIVLPNAMYGDWEGALYDYDYKLDPQQKSEKRRKSLIGY